MFWNKLLDASIYFSFDKSGFKRHKKNFKKIDTDVFKDKKILITGGTSGIGEALAKRLLNSHARVSVIGRSEEKFQKSDLKNIGASFISLDMCDLEGIKNFVKAADKFDFIVCNAGAMPSELKVYYDKFDIIFCSQVLGHYQLIKSLHYEKKINQNAPIHFTSSGGMYPVKLNLKDLSWDKRNYDKLSSYANAKRAQVILAEELTTLFPSYIFSSSHPGWVKTDVLEKELPGFYHWTKSRLRSPDEGADTIFWCLSQGNALRNGGFYFDRKLRGVYPFPWTKESLSERKELIRILDKYAK